MHSSLRLCREGRCAAGPDGCAHLLRRECTRVHLRVHALCTWQRVHALVPGRGAGVHARVPDNVGACAADPDLRVPPLPDPHPRRGERGGDVTLPEWSRGGGRDLRCAREG
eukprot:2903167-Rhodomonas_salina.1